MRKWLIVAGSLTIPLAASAYYFLNAEESFDIVFDRATVDRGKIESVVVATGALKPVNEVVVGSEISGQIAKLYVDFNDSVEEGELLARIDARTYEARVLQRTADVNTAKANIVSRNAELVRSQANFAQAERTYQRKVKLNEDGHVSDADLEIEFNQVQSMAASVEIAESSVVTANANLTQAEASLAQAELDLERTYIRSPVFGTVINRNVELGQTVAASLQAPELFTIAQDLHEMHVEASVDEADIGRVQEGMACRFNVDAFIDREFEGRVEQVRKAPTEAQNVVTYKVIVSANNDDLVLLPGMTANVSIILGTRDDVIKVPNTALRYAPREGVEVIAAGGSGSSEPSQRSGRPQGRGGGPDAMQAVLAELSLTEDQEAKVEELQTKMRNDMQRMFASMRGSGGQPGGGPGGGPPGRSAGGNDQARQQMRQVFDSFNRSLLDVLDNEQTAKYRELTSGRQETRRMQVFTLNVDGIHVRKNVVIGLQDDSAAEVVSGLEEGEEVIVRARRVS